MIRTGAGFGFGFLAGLALLGCSDQEGDHSSTAGDERGASTHGDASVPESSAESSTEVETDPKTETGDATAVAPDPEIALTDTVEVVDTHLEVDAGTNESPPDTAETAHRDASVEPKPDAQRPNLPHEAHLHGGIRYVTHTAPRRQRAPSARAPS